MLDWQHVVLHILNTSKSICEKGQREAGGGREGREEAGGGGRGERDSGVVQRQMRDIATQCKRSIHLNN